MWTVFFFIFKQKLFTLVLKQILYFIRYIILTICFSMIHLMWRGKLTLNPYTQALSLCVHVRKIFELVLGICTLLEWENAFGVCVWNKSMKKQKQKWKYLYSYGQRIEIYRIPRTLSVNNFFDMFFWLKKKKMMMQKDKCKNVYFVWTTCAASKNHREKIIHSWKFPNPETLGALFLAMYVNSNENTFTHLFKII